MGVVVEIGGSPLSLVPSWEGWGRLTRVMLFGSRNVMVIIIYFFLWICLLSLVNVSYFVGKKNIYS